MALSSLTRYTEALGDGVSDLWPYTFFIPDEDSLRVFTEVIATGVRTAVDPATFSITGLGTATGGTVTYPLTGAKLPATEKFIIFRDTAATQDVVITDQTARFAGVVMGVWDKLTALGQDQSAGISRTMRLREGTTGFDPELPAPIADTTWAVNSAGTAFITGPSVATIEAAEGYAQDTATDAVQTGLDRVATGEDVLAIEAIIAANPSVTAKSLGILTSNTGAQNSIALDAGMITAAAAGLSIKFASGTYELDRKPIIPSNTVLVDPSYGQAILKLSDTAHDDESILCGPMHGDASTARVDNVQVFGFTLDGNHARSSTIGDARPGGTCAAAGNIKDWVFYRTSAHGAKLHGFDVCNLGEHDGTNRVYSNGDNTHNSTGRSSGVRLIECRAWDCGDDTITAHFCDDVLIQGCTTSDASGRHSSPLAPNMIEIDDGANNVMVVNCNVQGPAVGGIVVKCHDGYPAATNVSIINNRISMCARGIYATDPTAVGVSPTTRGLTITGNTIFDLLFFDDPTDGEEAIADLNGIKVTDYVDVLVTNNRIYGNGLYEVDNAGTADERQTSSAIDFSSGAVFICQGNTISNWASDNVTDTVVAGIRPASSCKGVISGNIITDCGWRGIVDTGGNSGSVITGNIVILNSALSGSIAYRLSNHPDDVPTALVGNQALGAWEYALSLDTEDYTTMQDFTAAGSITSAFSANRATDIAMDLTSEITVSGYVRDHDLCNDFEPATGLFTCRYAGLHYFHGEIAFSEGDGSDDTGAIGLIHNGSLVRYHSINPRANSGVGKENTDTVSAEIMLARGDTVGLRVTSMSPTTPVIARNFRFYGGEK